MLRKTKIIATIGPASKSPEVLEQLIRAGTNLFRLNFSHGSHEEHLKTLTSIREVAADLRAPVAVLQDLSGPKIRISNVAGDYVALSDNTEIELKFADGSLSDEKTIYVEGLDPVQILEAGEPILLSDGMISLKAERKETKSVLCSVTKGGRLRSRVGIAFPDSAVELPATTEKDFKDLAWGIENKVDYVAISFVKNKDDVLLLRKTIDEKKSGIKIISKIERKRALDDIDAIVDVSDGLMVARGDLGLEFPLEKLPLLQKNLIEKCNHRGIPVIVATQMLHSMVTSVRPTRAEVSDISTAVMSGADALMLSEETAIGENPVESVYYLGRIAEESEKNFHFEEYKLRLRDADRETVPDAVAYAAAAAAIKVQAEAIISCTETGNSARLVAKYRPQQPLYGASPNEATLRRMALYWGVNPILLNKTTSHGDEIDGAVSAIAIREKLSHGSRVVVLGGMHVSKPGATNILEIREIE